MYNFTIRYVLLNPRGVCVWQALAESMYGVIELQKHLSRGCLHAQRRDCEHVVQGRGANNKAIAHPVHHPHS